MPTRSGSPSRSSGSARSTPSSSSPATSSACAATPAWARAAASSPRRRSSRRRACWPSRAGSAGSRSTRTCCAATASRTSPSSPSVPPMDVDELYRAPFDEFIARRDALAKQLRKDGKRDEADAVKKLKKPALSAWALTQLPSDALEGLLGAGAALRQARGGDTLRDATREERAAVDDIASQATALLRQAGHTVTDKTAGEIRDTLHAAALDDEAREELAAGRLVAPHTAVGVFGGAASAGTPAPKKKQKKPKKDQAEA